MRTLLKVCGLMNRRDTEACCAAGVNILGFVTEYPVPVPWNLSRKTAKGLLSHVSAPTKSCIVTGGEVEKIVSLASDLRPDYLQLHFQETLDDTKQILQFCKPMAVQVIKTIPLSPADRVRQFGTQDPARCAMLLEKIGVFAILVDSRAPSNAAGHGQAADLSLFSCIRDAVNIPVILAGGITPENGADIIQAVHPEIVDVMTGVESSPGRKDMGKVKALEAIVHASG